MLKINMSWPDSGRRAGAGAAQPGRAGARSGAAARRSHAVPGRSAIWRSCATALEPVRVSDATGGLCGAGGAPHAHRRRDPGGRGTARHAVAAARRARLGGALRPRFREPGRCSRGGAAGAGAPAAAAAGIGIGRRARRAKCWSAFCTRCRCRDDRAVPAVLLVASRGRRAGPWLRSLDGRRAWSPCRADCGAARSCAARRGARSRARGGSQRAQAPDRGAYAGVLRLTKDVPARLPVTIENRAGIADRRAASRLGCMPAGMDSAEAGRRSTRRSARRRRRFDWRVHRSARGDHPLRELHLETASPLRSVACARTTRP